MTEKLIYLEAVDLVEFLGVNNSKLDIIINKFPKLNITARGDWIKVNGATNEVADFEDKIKLLLDYYHQFNVLKESAIFEIINGEQVNSPENEKDLILFGINGRPIKARTENQRRLVKEFESNDLLFAVGPAGSGKTYTAIA
jgi:phosphate starvation-inducible PhoH-like protein